MGLSWGCESCYCGQNAGPHRIWSLTAHRAARSAHMATPHFIHVDPSCVGPEVLGDWIEAGTLVAPDGSKIAAEWDAWRASPGMPLIQNPLLFALASALTRLRLYPRRIGRCDVVE